MPSSTSGPCLGCLSPTGLHSSSLVLVLPRLSRNRNTSWQPTQHNTTWHRDFQATNSCPSPCWLALRAVRRRGGGWARACRLCSPPSWAGLSPRPACPPSTWGGGWWWKISHNSNCPATLPVRSASGGDFIIQVSLPFEKVEEYFYTKICDIF